MSDDEELPPRDAIWVALSLVTWAVVVAVTPTVRERIERQLERLSAPRAMHGQIVALSPTGRKNGDMMRATRIARTWVRRLLSEIRAARGV